MGKYRFEGQRIMLTTLSLAAFLFMQPSKGSAQEEEVAKAGRPAYEKYCAPCHGPEGKGNGPEAAKLKTKPTDLTQLKRMYNGEFPIWRIYGMIDGREEVRGHGPRDMPIWGKEFKQQAGSTHVAESQTRGRIFELIYYIESLQEK